MHTKKDLQALSKTQLIDVVLASQGSLDPWDDKELIGLIKNAKKGLTQGAIVQRFSMYPVSFVTTRLKTLENWGKINSSTNGSVTLWHTC